MNSGAYISIAKEAVAAMPMVTFPGGIIVVDTDQKAVQALEALHRERVVGFDTETRPTFHKGQHHTVSLIQISTGTHCYLFRINIIGFTDGLREFIEDSSVKKIGLSLKDDFFVLHKISEFAPEGFVDLQSYVQRFSITDASLQKIYAIVFGERISKGQRLSNWEADRLTEAQQCYAAIDAWACLRLYENFESGHFIPGESPYLRYPEPPVEEEEDRS